MNKGDSRGGPPKGPTSGSSGSGSGRSNPNPTNPLVRPPAPAPPPAPKRPALRPIGGVKPPAIRPLNVRPMTAPKPPANIKLPDVNARSGTAPFPQPQPPPPPPAESEDDATSVMDRSALFDPRELLEEMPKTVGRFPQARPAAGAPPPAAAPPPRYAPPADAAQQQAQAQGRQRWPSDAAWPPPSQHQPAARPARPPIDVVPAAQRTKSERTAVMPESPQRVLSPRTTKQTSSGLGQAFAPPANTRMPATARGHGGLPQQREAPAPAPAPRPRTPSVPDLDALLPPVAAHQSISNRPRVDDLPPPAPANTGTSPMAPMLAGRPPPAQPIANPPEASNTNSNLARARAAGARPTPPPRPYDQQQLQQQQQQQHHPPSFPPPPNQIPAPPGTVPLPLQSSAEETLAMQRVPQQHMGYGQQHIPYQQQQQHQHQHHSQYPHAYTPSAPPVAMYSNYPPPPVQHAQPQQTHPNARAHVSTHPGAIARGHVPTGSGAHGRPLSIPPAAAAPAMPLALQIAATMPAVGPPPGILGFVLFAAPLALSTAIIAALTLL